MWPNIDSWVLLYNSVCLILLFLLLLYLEFQMHVSPYYFTVHSLWPVEFPNGGQMEVTNTAMCHVWSDLLCPSLSTLDVFTLNSPATKHPPLATSPQSVRPSASSSTNQNHALHYTLVQMYCHDVNISITNIKSIIFWHCDLVRVSDDLRIQSM